MRPEKMCSAATSRRHSTYEMSGRRALLFRLDVGRPDHLAPLLRFIRDELAKIGRRQRERRAPEFGKPCVDFRIGECRDNLLVELVNDPKRRVSGHADAL